MSDLNPHSKKAYRIAATPSAFSDREIDTLLEVGHQPYANTDGGGEMFVDDADAFAKFAVDYQDGSFDKSIPVVDSPSQAAVLATHAAILIKHSPYFAETESVRGTADIQPIQEVKVFYRENLLALLNDHDRWFEVYQDIAEHLYQKEAGEDGPHPGRVCTGVFEIEEDGDIDWYLEFPIPALSQQMRVFDGDHDPENYATRWDIGKDNHVYVPLWDMTEKFDDVLDSNFNILASHAEDSLEESALAFLLEESHHIHDWISRQEEGNRYERLWVRSSTKRDVLRLLRSILEKDKIIEDPGKPLTAKEISQAVNRYTPENNREFSLVERVRSVKQVAEFLRVASEHEDTSSLVYLVDDERENLYEIRHGEGYKNANVFEVADLLELPCFQNIDEKLRRDGEPVRNELLNISATSQWLPKYVDSSGGFNKELWKQDVHEFFEQRYDWYDREETEKNLEADIQSAGERAIKPRGCKNENMQRFCIGFDQCPYSVYGSIDFVDGGEITKTSESDF